MDFTVYDPALATARDLVDAIFLSSAGVAVVDGSAVAQTGAVLTDSDLAEQASAISIYDGSISSLDIGAGLLLTTGDPTPNTENTDSGASGYLTASGAPGDADLENAVHLAFPDAGDLHDVAFLEFNINVTDPNATGLRFDVVFGSEEYPEYADSSWVDIAGVFVNGTNYALFGGSTAHPLSVLQANIDAGYFRNNDPWHSTGSLGLPIEYDGVSVRLQITAPIHQGVNTIKIAIGDTGDDILDSAIFVSGLQAVDYSGFGLSQQVDVTGTGEVIDSAGNQTYLGNALSNYITLMSGDDVVDGGGGLDEVHYGFASGGISSYEWDGHVLSLSNGDNDSQLVNVERVTFGDGMLVGLDTSAGGNIYGVAALFQAALDFSLFTQLAPNLMLAGPVISQWVAYADQVSALGGNLGDVAQHIIDTYVPFASNESIIATLYQNIIETPASPEEIQAVLAHVGVEFETMGDLYAYASLLHENTSEVDASGITGSIIVLDPSFF